MASPREKVLEDCLEFIGRRVIFSDGLLRLQYFQQFEDLYRQVDSLNSVKYGKIYILSEITEFLAILTQAARAKDEEPYAIDAPPGSDFVPRTFTFDKWKPSDWRSFRESLVQIQTSILRRDAKALINDIFSNEGEDREIDPLRSHDPWFTDKLFKLLNLFKFHEKLAPFRDELEIQSSIDEALMPLSLPKKQLNDFLDMVDEENEKRIKKAFLSFFKNDQTDTFHSPTTIRRLLDNPSQPHSFAFFLNRANKLMRAWTSQVLDIPTTTGICLRRDRRSYSEVARKTGIGQARALKKLQDARALLNEHVEDPLDDAVIAATDAKQWEISAGDRAFAGRTKISKKKRRRSPMPRGTMLDKKESATRLDFTPDKGSDSEDIEDPNEDDEILPDVKKRAKVASPRNKLKSQQKMYEGRRIWTDLEKNSIIQGVRSIGIGKWAEIKRIYFMALQHRTSGQIKDCYRTMKKRGELGDLDEGSPRKEVASKDDKGEQNLEGEHEEEQNPAEEEKDEK